jgi:hypothetical protein
MWISVEATKSYHLIGARRNGEKHLVWRNLLTRTHQRRGAFSPDERRADRHFSSSTPARWVTVLTAKSVDDALEKLAAGSVRSLIEFC